MSILNHVNARDLLLALSPAERLNRLMKDAEFRDAYERGDVRAQALFSAMTADAAAFEMHQEQVEYAAATGGPMPDFDALVGHMMDAQAAPPVGIDPADVARRHAEFSQHMAEETAKIQGPDQSQKSFGDMLREEFGDTQQVADVLAAIG